jgi:hypothetical protein
LSDEIIVHVVGGAEIANVENVGLAFEQENLLSSQVHILDRSTAHDAHENTHANHDRSRHSTPFFDIGFMPTT